jgi:hypothetical protein
MEEKAIWLFSYIIHCSLGHPGDVMGSTSHLSLHPVTPNTQCAMVPSYAGFGIGPHSV